MTTDLSSWYTNFISFTEFLIAAAKATLNSDAGKRKKIGAVVIGGDNLPSPVGIGLTDLPNICLPPPWPTSSGITAVISIFLHRMRHTHIQQACSKGQKSGGAGSTG